jgi:hypothetical protein
MPALGGWRQAAAHAGKLCLSWKTKLAVAKIVVEN